MLCALPSLTQVDSLIIASPGDGHLHVYHQGRAAYLGSIPFITLSSSMVDRPDEDGPRPFLLQASSLSLQHTDSNQPILLLSCTGTQTTSPIELYFVQLNIQDASSSTPSESPLTYHILKCLRGQEQPIYAHFHPENGTCLVGSPGGYENVPLEPRSPSPPPPSEVRESSLTEGTPLDPFSKEAFPGRSYTWRQEGDRIHFSLPLPSTYKEDIQVGLGADALSLHPSTRPLPRILSFYDRVSSESRWSIQDREHGEGKSLEVSLVKVASLLHWPHLWKEDDDVLEEGIASAIDPMEEETMEEVERTPNPSFLDLPPTLANMENITMRGTSLEEGEDDGEEEDGSSIYPTFQLWALDQSQPISTLLTGGQSWLGEARSALNGDEGDSKSFPRLFLRNDIDGLLYTPSYEGSDARLTVKHSGTLGAFGYVRSSKTEARFVLAVERGEVGDQGIIIDLERRAYLYSSPSTSSPTDHGIQTIAELGSGLVMGWGLTFDCSTLLLLTESSLLCVPMQ